MNVLRSVRVGRGFDSPLVHCRLVLIGISVKFEYVFSEFWRARAEFPEPNFPKSLPQFADLHPELNFINSPKNLQYFWDFSRIQTLGTFVLYFRYFEFTARVCRSFEFTIGSTVAR